MRIGDLLAQGDRSFSFEFFPPKDEAGEEVLWRSISELEPLDPTFVSVTYGAGGTTRDRTVAITGRIARETSMLPVAHLTCVGHTEAEIEHILDTYSAAGVTHGVPGPASGSPRSASTLRTPDSRSESRIRVSSAVVCPTQVRCAIGSSVVSRAIRPVIAMVRSRVVPPAP